MTRLPMATREKKQERRATRHSRRKPKDTTTENHVRGGGSTDLQTEILQVDSEIKKDLGILSRGVRERWPGLIQKGTAVVERLASIIEKTVVIVPIGEGVGPSEDAADKNSIAASRVYVAMMAQNQKDEIEHERKSQPGSQTTINVGVNVDNRNDERRTQTLAIAERIRARRILRDA